MGAKATAECWVYRVSAEGFLQGSSGEVPSTGDPARAGEDDAFLQGNCRSPCLFIGFQFGLENLEK